MAITQAQMRMLQRRRTSDVDRLMQQYKRDIESMTGEYESAFAKYQKLTAEQMAPYEAELEKYKTTIQPSYEAQVAEYQKRLDAYNAELEALAASPTVRKTGTYQEKVPRWGLFGLAGYETKTRTYEYDEPKPVPTFTEKAPEMPNAPQAPTVEKFDTSKFEQRKSQLETDLRREVGERKAGRLAAVSRRTRRPMLQGE